VFNDSMMESGPEFCDDIGRGTFDGFGDSRPVELFESGPMDELAREE